MLLGNQDNADILRKYIDNSINNVQKSISFFIVSGSKDIGKSTIIQDMIKEYLGPFFYSDFLHIRDLSYDLGKSHTLKVELPKKIEKQFIETKEGLLYEDIGIREVNMRLQKSSASKNKFVLLENIERMNASALNAFLKTCEEPLSGRIIIATTSNQTKLLDTILSRAIVINFRQFDYDEMLKFADDNKLFGDDQEIKKFFCNMAMGKPLMLLHLHTLFESNKEIKSDFINIFDLLKKNASIAHSFNVLKRINQSGYLLSFVDAWIAYCIQNNMSSRIPKWLKFKKMIDSNMNIENLLIYALM